MRSLILFALLLFSVEAYSQTFSFRLYFSDAIGNRDTLTLGYDVSATDSIDRSFGEVNIIGVPLDTGLDVRVTNELYNRSFLFQPCTYHTKKQISYYDCSVFRFPIPAIDIVTDHWPVTASWDSTLFNDTCRNGSLITGIPAGYWWDVGGISDLFREVLSQRSSVTFTSNAGPVSVPFDITSYRSDAGQMVPVFWVAIADSGILTTSVTENNFKEFKLYPNPATNEIHYSIGDPKADISEVLVLSSTGETNLHCEKSETINISKLPKGFYVLKVNFKNGKYGVGRFIKIE